MVERVENGFAHISILREEILSFVRESVFSGEGLFADCTCGEGGHSEILLSTFPNLKIIAFERDPEILAIAEKRLKRFGSRIEFVNSNFSEISSIINDKGLELQYILFDFGISSYHFDKSGRGFSFRAAEPLDMRLDSDNGRKSAADFVNYTSERDLTDIFYRFGEERWAKKIAAYICAAREKHPFKTTEELADIVKRAIPKRFHVKNIHPATRVFQALRIAVNGELDSIQAALKDLWKLVNDGGRIMAISFHSLEDRLVKNAFRDWARGCSCGREGRECMCTEKPFVKILSKKPVIPSEDEIAANKRARSAKLRACERISA